MKRKIIDCFMFYNELDLITYRLNILNNVVDYFVIVESTHTFSGKEKKLYSNELTELFYKFKDKIIHIVVDDFPFKYPNINYDNKEQWKNEKFQRNCIKRGLDNIDVDILDNDIILISDLDEIPDPNTLNLIKEEKINVTVNVIEQDFYYYNLNTKSNKKWNGTRVILYSILKNKNNIIQYYRNNQFPVINNGGWHLSFFGDKYFIKNKIENFSHQEYNNEFYTNLNIIEERVNNCIDMFNRVEEIYNKIPINENNYLPPDYEIYLNKFFIH